MLDGVRAVLGPMFVAAAVALAGACQTRAASTKFTGTAHPVIALVDQIASYTGSSPPDEHQVIGVVTARCTTLDGTAGELDAPCSKNAMTIAAKQVAAKVGGSALLDVRCAKDETDHAFGRFDGGAEQTATRALVICQATVLRHIEGRPLPSSSGAADGGLGDHERITVSSTPLEIAFTRGKPLGATLKPSEVGVLEQIPEGYPNLGLVKASCLQGCARASARRGLQHAAIRVGALVIAEVKCQLVLERWHCVATALGRPPELPDAGIADAL